MKSNQIESSIPQVSGNVLFLTVTFLVVFLLTLEVGKMEISVADGTNENSHLFEIYWIKRCLGM